ncbi:hypothetical protein MBANPS3_004631 [Mucor bainieri]
MQAESYEDGMLRMAELFETGKGARGKNRSEAFKTYNLVPKHYKRGEAAYRMGRLLLHDDNTLKQNYAQAEHYLNLARGYGNVKAIYELGRMHEFGWGMKLPRCAEAMNLYNQALNAGHFEAAKRLGLLLLQAPEGIPQDLKLAEKNLRMFEEKCQADAETHIAIGHCHQSKGTEGSRRFAAKRYMNAVDLNSSYACYCLGQLYEDKSPKDMAKAVEWYEKGKAMEDPNCMQRLGLLFASGDTVRKDLDTARSLLERASKLGLESAAKGLKKIEAEIAKREQIEASKPSEPRLASEDHAKLNEKEAGSISPEGVDIQSSADPREQLVRIIKMPAERKSCVANAQVKATPDTSNQAPATASKTTLQNNSYQSTSGYKFKTKADLEEQFQKAKASSPFSPFHMLEISATLLQSRQAQFAAGLDATNKTLMESTLSMTHKLEQLSIEHEQSTAIINSNNVDIAEKFEQVEDSMEMKYNHVCQRLDVLETESAVKDKIIDMLMSKLDSQSKQLETLMRSMERR